ncbi:MULTISPECIES: ComEC/Rec2 family competence protein [Paenibacillus]|uniref:ComEC/Rec2 family competence protein n=1 Tax=Paenibacillus TaxID=44249 RepID=UPI002FE40A6A
MNRHHLENISKVWTGWLLLCFLIAGCSIQVGEGPVQGKATSPPSAATKTDGQLRVIFLDVGQGASQLLIGPSGRTMLIDAGDNSEEQRMLDYLREYGVERIDIVVGTHPDADHIGGLDAVIGHHKVGAVYMPKIQANTKTFESLLESIRERGLKVKTAKAGLRLDWDDQVDVRLIGPVEQSDDSNNMSAVMKVTFGETSFLLTGDAERESEKAMLASGADVQADVLLVGHHGSTSSTSLSFLRKVSPKYAVIQVGENSYGHPKKEILDRLRKQNVQVYRNDRQGTIETVSDGQGIRITTER